MVFDAALFYKIGIKGKVEHFSVVAIKKGALGSPSTKVANFTYLYRVKWFQDTNNDNNP